jgi:hypothetical protein
MAKKYKKTKEELKSIFDVKGTAPIQQHAGFGNNGVSQKIQHADIEFFRAELKMIEAKVDILKSLEFKIDLLLERKGR